MLKRSDKQPSPKPCPFCGSEARIRNMYDVVDWTDDDEPMTERRFVCECSGVECWVSPVTDPFDTEEEAIEAWNRRSEALEREPKSEWQKDREILKAYSDGANGVLDELRAEIAEEKEHAYADFERYKVEYLGQDWEDALDSLARDDFRYGMERCIDIINKFKTESEKQMQPERDCVNCVYSKDGHISFSETCHNCIWENQFIPKFMPKRIKASDIKPDDEWMKENGWDEIYKAESEESE